MENLNQASLAFPSYVEEVWRQSADHGVRNLGLFCAVALPMSGLSCPPRGLRGLLSFRHHDYITTYRKEKREKRAYPLFLRILSKSSTNQLSSQPNYSLMAIHHWKGNYGMLSLFQVARYPAKDEREAPSPRKEKSGLGASVIESWGLQSMKAQLQRHRTLL